MEPLGIVNRGSRECPGCGADVSGDASYCPNCGGEVKGGGRPVKIGVLLGVAMLFLVIGAVISGALPLDGDEVEEAPGFTAGDVLTGENHSLSDYRGKWVLLDFSTAWCSVCQQMEPVLEKYFVESRPEDVVFLTISNEKDREAFKQFASEKEYSSEAEWPHLIDQSSSVYVKYGIQVLPTFVLVGPDGGIRAKSTGYMSYAELERFVDEAKAGASGTSLGL